MAKLVGDARYAIVTDHLGTPTAMYDAAGAEVWSATIDAYGDLRNITGTRTACPFRWPGQYEDAETGLYYNRFRYYDPSEGAYIAVDPIGIEGGLSPREYARLPTTFADPLGLIVVYHYTDKKGYNAIRAGRGEGKSWWFKATKPRADHPVGVYLTPLGPDTEKLVTKARISHAKSEYFFKFEIPESQLKRIRGDRGRFVLYSANDLDISESQQIASGCTR